MQSSLNPSVVYEFNQTVPPHDFDVESDAWVYDGKEVFRGTRDPSFQHADVYWLYDETIKRIGLAEHEIEDHSIFHVLWYYECPFATFFQEDGWHETGETVWSMFTSRAYEYCMEYGITSVEDLRKFCMRGSYRIITPECLTKQLQDYPDRSKILVADNDCVLYTPPENSKIWTITN
jgi:hypothetical protein